MYQLKAILDAARTGISIPMLVNSQGDTLYHPRQGGLLFSPGIGRHISNFEQTTAFSEYILPNFISGSPGEYTVELAWPAATGDETANGVILLFVKATFFYGPVGPRPLYLAFALAEEDLVQTTYYPSEVKDGVVLWITIDPYFQLPNLLPQACGSEENAYQRALQSGCIYNPDNCANNSVNILQLFHDTKTWSSIIHFIGPCSGNCDPGNVLETCTTKDSCRVNYFNCKNDDQPGRFNGSWCGLNGAPDYMCAGTCVCDEYRWSVYFTTARWPAIQLATKCFEDPVSAHYQEYTVEKVEAMHKFINKLPNAQNIPPFISDASYTDTQILRKLVQRVLLNDKMNHYEDVLFHFFSSETGATLEFPISDTGNDFDATQRPWYKKAKGLSKRWKYSITNPYYSYGGAEILVGLSVVIFENQVVDFLNSSQSWSFGNITNSKIWGVSALVFLYQKINNWMANIGNCSQQSLTDNVYTHQASDKPMCFLIDESGLLITHSDFLVTEQGAFAYMSHFFNFTGKATSEWKWHLNNVFLGEKEPALAKALLDVGFLIPRSSKSVINDRMLFWFDTNHSLVQDFHVLAGTLSDQTCYESKDTNWFLSHVPRTNTYIIVVENYQYTLDGASRTGSCPPFSSPPVEPFDISSSQAVNTVSHQPSACLPCVNVPYTAAQIEVLRPENSKSNAGNGKCAEVDYPGLNTSTGLGLLTVACSLLLGLIFSILFTTVHRNCYVLRTSCASFCLLMQFGCCLGYVTSVVYLLRPSHCVCLSRIWLSNLAFVFSFGPLLIKTWRVHKISTNHQLRRLKLSDTKIMHIFGVMLSFYVAFTLAYTLAAGVCLQTITDPNDPTVIYLSCNSHHQIWGKVSIGLAAIITIFGVVLCVEVRNVREEFNESFQISICIYNMFLIGALILPLLFFLQPSIPAQVILIWVGIIATSTVTWSVIMIPKFLKINWSTAEFESRISPEDASQRPNSGTNKDIRRISPLLSSAADDEIIPKYQISAVENLQVSTCQTRHNVYRRSVSWACPERQPYTCLETELV